MCPAPTAWSWPTSSIARSRRTAWPSAPSTAQRPCTASGEIRRRNSCRPSSTGSAAPMSTPVCATWHGSGIDTLEKFMTREVVLGSSTIYHANLLNSLFGAKLKQVRGYPGGNDVLLALERGEVQGRCNWSWSSIIGTRSEWVSNKKINLVLQFAEEKHPDLPNVPLVGELAKTEQQRQMIDLVLSSQAMARPFVAPPHVPVERVSALRRAFMEMAEDP